MTDNSKIGSNERFVRWQTALRGHLSFLNNLLLTISIGVVGFCISLLGQENFNPLGCAKNLFTFGLITIAISTVLGIMTIFCRLIDLRVTVKKIKNELKGQVYGAEETKKLMENCGKITWCLLYLQTGTFGVGALFLLLAFGEIYYGKLF